VRNRLKRLLREVVRARLGRLKGGFAAAFYLRAGMLKRTYEDVAAEVDRLLPKTPLI
jgi:ribonuclease P protein component